MKRTILFVVPLILISLLLGVVIGKFYNIDNFLGFEKDQVGHEVRVGQGSLINPLLECEAGQGIYKVTGLDPLRRILDDYIAESKAKGLVNHASVYFRDLNNGPWFGINEHETFVPASLLKLPIAIAYYYKAENEGREILTSEVKFDQDVQSSQVFSPPSRLLKGKSYKVKDLISTMLLYSDNTAAMLLLDKIGEDYVRQVMDEIAVEVSESKEGEQVTVKGYAGLYRILYNTAFLTRDDSTKVLTMLLNTHFKEGIVKGVPPNIKVAHKYGEKSPEGDSQLHDCGIVYYKQNPYILCIMTRGSNYKNLASVIAHISDVVYKEIARKYK